MPEFEKNSDKKRIAKNTIVLYGRMLVMMCISLFTSRIVLDTLGITDYGIQNVIGSLVGSITFISCTLSGALSRFLTYEIGRRDMERLKSVFSTSLTLQTIQAFIIALVLEAFGVWYLNTNLVLPPERLFAANVIFQFSVLSSVLYLIFTVYSSSIVAHERMTFYAYTSLLDAGLKLLVVYSLYISPYDKLITNAALGLAAQLIGILILVLYCKHHFEECRFSFRPDWKMAREIGAYAVWNLLSPISSMLRSNGMNLLINAFFGPVMNAAQGVASTVGGATRQLASSFMAATRPQITKCYAAGDVEESVSLVFLSARLTCALLLAFMLPIILEADAILGIWLVEVPSYAVVLVQLTLIHTIVENFSTPIDYIVQANGNISRYEMINNTISLLILPLAYLLLQIGFSPACTVWTNTLIVTVCIFIKVYLANKVVKEFSPIKYFRRVLIPSIVFVIAAALVPLAITLYWQPSFIRMFVTICVAILCTIILFPCICLNAHERMTVIQLVKTKFKK